MASDRVNQPRIFVSLTGFTYNERGLFFWVGLKKTKKEPCVRFGRRSHRVEGLGLYPNSLVLWVKIRDTSSESYLGNPLPQFGGYGFFCL